MPINTKTSITSFSVKLFFLATFYISIIPQSHAIYSDNTETNTSSQHAIIIDLPETVELAMIVALVSDFDLNGSVIQINNEYARVAKEHFQPFSEHPIFKALGRDFNLPRLAGNAADFHFNQEGKLIEFDASGSIWGDAEGDLFRKHLALIQDFSDRSQFRQFYQSKVAEYDKGIKKIAANTDTAAMTTWLHKNFTARPGPMQIIVSPLIGGLNWTTLFKPQTRMFVAKPSDTNEQPLSLFERVLQEYSIFTELDHSYVNVVTKKWLSQIDGGLADQSKWVTPNSSAASYPTAELQFNEYSTWAVYLMYASDQLPPKDYEELEETIVSFMQKQRGFKAFKEFADEALKLYTKNDFTAEDTIEYLAKWTLKFGTE